MIGTSSRAAILKCITVILYICACPALAAYNKWGGSGKLSEQHVTSSLPEFDDLSLREINAKSGQTVLLPCTVKNLGDKVVSWIRTRDLHILTSGAHTFSADNRFESVNSALTNFWGMRVRGVRPSDAGQYECQVNTDPKMSLAINLTVTDNRIQNDARSVQRWINEARIKGPGEVHVKHGNPAVFACEISAVSAPSHGRGLVVASKGHIYWLRDGKQISLESSRGGISVETDYRDLNSVSRLRVAEVSPRDSGLYTCTQASAKPASVRLFVVEAEHTEAMQRDAPPSSANSLHNYSNVLNYAFIYYVFLCIKLYS